MHVAAKLFKTNTGYFSKVLNEHKRLTFKQYIRKLRINYIVEKIESEKSYRSYTIQALANEIGYKNASSFAKAFKEELGQNPSDFLKSLKRQ